MKWRLEPCDGWEWAGLYNVRDEKGNFIAAAVSKEEGDLIVAAPDLLEACKQIVWKLSHNSCLPDYEGPGRITRLDATVKMAVATIAKVEGGQE